MNPPRQIKVGPVTYTVSTSPADMSRARSDEPGLMGITDFPQLRITIDPTQAEPVMRDTLLHEVLHTLTRLTGIDADMGTEAEERMVNRLAPALLDCLRRNPRLVDYLLA